MSAPPSSRPHRSPVRRTAGLLVGLALLAGCTSQRVPTKYTDSVHKSFVRGCVGTTTQDAKKNPSISTGPQVTSFCECAYAAIVKNVEFKEFKKVTDTLTEKHQVLPASFQKAYSSCPLQGSETSGPTTTKPTSAPATTGGITTTTHA